MQIIGRIKLNTRKTSRKEVFINIGLVSIVVSIVIELFLGNYAMLALIVPFLYLLSIKKTTGSPLYKDVLIQLDRNNTDYTMSLPDSVFLNNRLCSLVYSFKQSDFNGITYNQKTGCANIKFVGDEVVLFDNQKTRSSLGKEIVLSLYISRDECNQINSYLEQPGSCGYGQDREK